MKKVGVFLVAMFFTLLCMGQEYQKIEEIEVIAPTCNGEMLGIEMDFEGTNVLNAFLNAELQKEAEMLGFQSGTVVLDFTVLTDGTISGFIIQNSVSNLNDEAVKRAVQLTSGCWNPGVNNGTPIIMEKRIAVNFVNPDGKSLEELAKEHYLYGIKKINIAENIENSYFLTQEQKDRKMKRKLHAALYHFKEATRLLAAEPSVVLWELKAYEKLGDVLMSEKKELQYLELTHAVRQSEPEYVAALTK